MSAVTVLCTPEEPRCTAEGGCRYRATVMPPLEPQVSASEVGA